MCGLMTILDWKVGGWSSEKAATHAVVRGITSMSYRGHAERSRVEAHGRTILGHVRLPIIGSGVENDQPLHYGGDVITFVGEIFNYKDFDFEANSDTEVFATEILNSGVRSLYRFDGFWAATFCRPGVATFVVTDYLSQKPLYFHEQSLLVSSEITPMLDALKTTPPLDQVYFSNVLKWGYDPTGRTPYQGIIQLPAGSVLKLSLGRLTLEKYWNWDQVPLEDSLQSLLCEATLGRLVGDKEVGLLLSGGLDSTIVFKILTELLGRTPWVFHTQNREDGFLHSALNGYPATILESTGVTMDRALVAHQVPVDLGSVAPQLALAGAVRDQGLNVVMTGDGADELFGGYRRALEYDSQASDVFVELPYYHHPRLDRLMMRKTVELRSPFMAPKVIKYALSLPRARRTAKEELKKVFGGIVPFDIIAREKLPLRDSGFSATVAHREFIISKWKDIFYGSSRSVL